MAKSFKFTKMQGLGNDFILVDAAELGNAILGLTDICTLSDLAVRLCDRNFGVGADGLIVVNPDDMMTSDTDFVWRIINSDGSEPQMCGNGIRCFARYLVDKGLTTLKKFSVNTLAGKIIPEVLDDGTVKVDMGAPVLEPCLIPVSTGQRKFEIIALDKKFEVNAVSMGNPHCVIFTDEASEELAVKYGPSIEINPVFPEKTNVEFVKVLSKNHLKIDVWERGCGITLACGTGTCATVVAAILNGLVENAKKIKCDLPGGTLTIEWSGNVQDHVFMTGAANFVFEGVYPIK